MGCYGKYEEKLDAIRLRKKGWSYNDIRQKLHISKSSVSLWCRDVALTSEQTFRLLQNQIKGSDRGRIISAKQQQKKRIEKTKKLFNLGKTRISKLSKRDRFIAGVALYAGDGAKGDKGFAFSNSSQNLVRFMVDWVREFYKIPESRIKGSLWLHEGLDELKAKKFWSKTIRIPLNQFTKTYIAQNKPDSRKIRKNIHQYGVLGIKISDSDLQREIVGLMAGVLGDDIV
jgi:hypothetical protein